LNKYELNNIKQKIIKQTQSEHASRDFAYAFEISYV